jgi:methylenetetrahydrofolate dehydrogenase (NADP+)/methenyltetrahydrofolate cyclohydrolase
MEKFPLLLSARSAVAALNEKTHAASLALRSRLGRPAKLAVILVGDDPASVIYTRKKGEAALRLGMAHESFHFPASVSPSEVQALTERLNADPGVDGILIQRPLPAGFDDAEVLYWIHPSKDVDAFHPENHGRLILGLPGMLPCTPVGILALLDHYGIPVESRTACVVGRSAIVGKPMAGLLLRRNATVIQAHRHTRDLPEITRTAEILIVATGSAGLIGPEHVRPGAVVIDVGIHRSAEGKLSGDVRFAEVSPLCSAISPVPGGVGPMTIAALMANTVLAAETAATPSTSQ